jgi:predicted acyl esterase
MSNIRLENSTEQAKAYSTFCGTCFSLFVKGCSLLVVATLSAATGDSFLPDTSGFRGMVTRIPTRDDKSLAADIYLPKRPGKYPVILVQTPYDRKNMRRHWNDGAGDGPDPLFTDPNYAFAVTDRRGRYESKDADTGVLANFGNDGYDTIAWIIKQDWSNGRVGTWGPSALGKVQYETAQQHPPGLICAVPMVMPLNLNYDIYFPGGVLWEEFATMLTKLGFSPDMRGYLAAHPLKDQFWESLPAASAIHAEEFMVPMLFIGGWYDIYTDSVISAFEQVRAKAGPAARAHSKLIMGPWIHAGDVARTGALEFLVANHYGLHQAHAFFDYWLRNQSNGFDEQPPITYFQMGAGEWRNASAWPPAKPSREFFLHGDASLQLRKPSRRDQALHFTYDPSNPLPTIGGHVLDPELHGGPQDQREKVESRPDVLVFTTPALDTRIEIAGKIRIRLYASSDRTDTDFAAILTDVYPDGRSILIGEAIQRMRLRNSASKEEFMTPGEVYPVTIEIPSAALTFLPGHRVRLIVSSSDFPKFARNWNDGGPMYGAGPGVKAVNSIYADEVHASAILLPVTQH